MEYNTERELLAIPEYGRHLKKMIDHACTIEDKEERNRAAKEIVKVMSRVAPQGKEDSHEDYMHKLWDHLIIISDFMLDIDAPFSPPDKELRMKKPGKVNYPTGKIKYRYYGDHVIQLIKKAKELDDGEEKVALVKSIANLMKRFYLIWNRDSVEDQLILHHLKELSDGALNVPEDFTLVSTSEVLSRFKPVVKPKVNKRKSRRKKSNR